MFYIQKNHEASLDQKSTKDEPQVVTSTDLQVKQKTSSPSSPTDINAMITLTSPATSTARARKLSASSPASENIPKTYKESQESSLEENTTHNELQSASSNSLQVQETLKPSRSSPTSEINSKTAAFSRPATTSARARKLSDSGAVKPRRKAITRTSSELDLSGRQRSRTTDSLSLSPHTSTPK